MPPRRAKTAKKPKAKGGRVRKSLTGRAGSRTGGMYGGFGKRKPPVRTVTRTQIPNPYTIRREYIPTSYDKSYDNLWRFGLIV